MGKESNRKGILNNLIRIIELDKVPKGGRIIYILSLSIMLFFILGAILGMIILAIFYISPEFYELYLRTH
jgi:hypothetical protein